MFLETFPFWARPRARVLWGSMPGWIQWSNRPCWSDNLVCCSLLQPFAASLSGQNDLLDEGECVVRGRTRRNNMNSYNTTVSAPLHSRITILQGIKHFTVVVMGQHYGIIVIFWISSIEHTVHQRTGITEFQLSNLTDTICYLSYTYFMHHDTSLKRDSHCPLMAEWRDSRICLLSCLFCKRLA